MEEWKKTYDEENGIKKRKLTWGKSINKVFYSDPDVGFSKIHFSPLNDTQKFEKHKYFKLTTLALDFSPTELTYQTSVLPRGTNYILSSKKLKINL